jgi:hypothetical protein
MNKWANHEFIRRTSDGDFLKGAARMRERDQQKAEAGFAPDRARESA